MSKIITHGCHENMPLILILKTSLQIQEAWHVHMFLKPYPNSAKFCQQDANLQMRTLLGKLLLQICSQFTLQHFLSFAHRDFFQQRFSTKMKMYILKKNDWSLFLKTNYKYIL